MASINKPINQGMLSFTLAFFERAAVPSETGMIQSARASLTVVATSSAWGPYLRLHPQQNWYHE
jgi:hypothetical protein